MLVKVILFWLLNLVFEVIVSVVCVQSGWQHGCHTLTAQLFTCASRLVLETTVLYCSWPAATSSQHGYAWAFNMVIKVTDALAEQENVNSWIHYPPQQALEYGGTQLLSQQDQQMAFQLIHSTLRSTGSQWNTMSLTTGCILESSTFKARFVERMVQQVFNNRQMELQHESIEVQATENDDNNDAQMSGWSNMDHGIKTGETDT